MFDQKGESLDSESKISVTSLLLSHGLDVKLWADFRVLVFRLFAVVLGISGAMFKMLVSYAMYSRYVMIITRVQPMKIHDQA